MRREGGRAGAGRRRWLMALPLTLFNVVQQLRGWIDKVCAVPDGGVERQGPLQGPRHIHVGRDGVAVGGGLVRGAEPRPGETCLQHMARSRVRVAGAGEQVCASRGGAINVALLLGIRW